MMLLAGDFRRRWSRVGQTIGFQWSVSPRANGRRLNRIVCPTLIVIGLGLLLPAQQVSIEPQPKAGSKQKQKPVNESPQADLRVDTTVVLVPVSVNDKLLNRPVSGLEKENFRIFDNQVAQKITSFSMDDEDVAVGLVFDTSGSMGSTLQRSRMAAMEFFKTSNPEDEFFLVEFDDTPRMVVPLTHNTNDISQQLLFSRSHGSTALLDAIYLSLHEVKKSKKAKKALLIISDGGDNHSRYTETEVQNVLRESDSLIYAIGVFGGGSGLAEEIDGPRMLRRVAEQTGGRLLEGNAGDLPDIARKISTDLRNRYVIGYSPTDKTRDGRYHRVQVNVVPPRGLPPLVAHWRLGYYAQRD
jgi:Ca-activated chloride channel family protein